MRQDHSWASEPALSEVFGVTIGDIARRSPAVSGNKTVAEVKELFPTGTLQGIVIVDDEGKPAGLVMKNDLYYHLAGQYGVPLYYNRPIRVLMDKDPLVVDAHLPLEAVSRQAMARQEQKLYDLVIVTREGRYWGSVSIIDMLRCITDMQLRLAASSNPLTGLPGNLVIEERLKQLIAKNEPFSVLYIDLDNFKAYNDKYGFERGDQALLLTAAILSQALAACSDSRPDFLGHIGGDDFIIMTHPAKAPALCQFIVKQFDQNIHPLYPPDDLICGFVTVTNRKGQEECFPLITISIAVVDNLDRAFTNYLELGEVAAQLKRRAKAIEGSVWVSDRRKLGRDKS